MMHRRSVQYFDAVCCNPDQRVDSGKAALVATAGEKSAQMWILSEAMELAEAKAFNYLL